jgi:hypothetical protein
VIVIKIKAGIRLHNITLIPIEGGGHHLLSLAIHTPFNSSTFIEFLLTWHFSKSCLSGSPTFSSYSITIYPYFQHDILFLFPTLILSLTLFLSGVGTACFHHVVTKIRHLFLRSAVCLTSSLFETGVKLRKHGGARVNKFWSPF